MKSKGCFLSLLIVLIVILILVFIPVLFELDKDMCLITTDIMGSLKKASYTPIRINPGIYEVLDQIEVISWYCIKDDYIKTAVENKIQIKYRDMQPFILSGLCGGRK